MNDTALKVVGDVSAAAAVLGAMMNWLPPFAVLFTVVWTGLQIFSWVEKRWEERKWPFSRKP